MEVKTYSKVSYEFLVGYELSRIRSDLGLKQTDVAKLANKPQSTIGRIEQGKACTIGNLLSLCAVYNTTLSNVLSEIDKLSECLANADITVFNDKTTGDSSDGKWITNRNTLISVVTFALTFQSRNNV